MFSAIGSILGGIFGIGNSDQTSVNENLQAQIDADNKRDKAQGIIGVSALLLSIIALIFAVRKK